MACDPKAARAVVHEKKAPLPKMNTCSMYLNTNISHYSLLQEKGAYVSSVGQGCDQ